MTDRFFFILASLPAQLLFMARQKTAALETRFFAKVSMFQTVPTMITADRYSVTPLIRWPMAVLTRVFFTRKCMTVFARRPKKSGRNNEVTFSPKWPKDAVSLFTVPFVNDSIQFTTF